MSTSDQDRAAAILTPLDGVDNIVEIDPCTTRLRALVTDPGVVNTAALKAAGTYGVAHHGRGVRIVVGPEADTLASDIEDLR